MNRFIAATALTMFVIDAAHAGSSISQYHADATASQSVDECMLDRGSAAFVEKWTASALSHSTLTSGCSRNSTHR